MVDTQIQRILLRLSILFSELKGDLESCYNRANYFINKSYIIDLKIIFVFVAGFFVLLIIRSGNPTSFLINLINIIIVSSITFLIYCSADRFWYLFNKAQLYRWGISDKRYIKRIVDKLNKYEEVEPEAKNLKAQILMATVFSSNGHKMHIYRIAIEIFVLLWILFIYFPDVFLFNIILVGATYIYVSLYERQFMEQVIFDLIYLAKLIRLFHKENPKECRSFILNHELKEIRDLKLLYGKIIQLLS